MAGLNGHHGSPVVAFTLKKNSAMERGVGGGRVRTNDIDDNYVIINIMSMVDVVITKIWEIKLE